MLTKNKGIFSFSQFRNLGVLAAFSTNVLNLNFRNQSISQFEEAFGKFAVAAGFDPSRAAFFNQVHGANSIEIDAALIGCGWKRLGQELLAVDAGCTVLSNAPIVIFTADCIPLFVADEKARTVAILHVGWRGADAGIISKTLLKIANEFTLQISDLTIGIGPSIRSCCYEVGAEFELKFDGWTEFRNEKYYFDLAGFSKDALARLGIPEGQMIDSEICTVCHSDFHSHRRDGEKAGRMASVIMKLVT